MTERRLASKNTSHLGPIMSDDAFSRFGIETVVYTRPVIMSGIEMVALHAADGRRLTVLPNEAVAFGEVVRNDLRMATVN